MFASLFVAAALSATSTIAPYVETNNFSGVVLVDRAGKTIARHAYGLADVEQNVPVSFDTRFYIASLSKMFTAAAILQLRDAKRLTLDDPLSRFVADFPRGETITIRHLLTHRSGLPQDSSAPDYFDRATRSFALSEAVDLIRSAQPVDSPGKRRIYSNSNYVLLAYVVERASGAPLDAYLSSHFFTPLGIRDTGLHHSWNEIVARRARGYSPVGVRDLVNARYYDYSIGTGAGSAFSTVDDLRRWMRGPFVQEALRERYVGGPFDIGSHHGFELTGWDGVGFAAAIIYVPSDDVLTIVLSNRNVPSVASDLAESLAKLVYGESVEPLDLAKSTHAPATLAGRYRLGDDFYVPGTILDIVACGDALCEKQRDGRLVALLPTVNGDYIHRSSWGRIRFHANGLRFYDQFEAVRVP